MRLPYDISRCVNDQCPIRKTCARWVVPGRDGYQSFTAFKGGSDCESYIYMKEPK